MNQFSVQLTVSKQLLFTSNFGLQTVINKKNPKILFLYIVTYFDSRVVVYCIFRTVVFN